MNINKKNIQDNPRYIRCINNHSHCFWAIIFFDVAAYKATGAQTLTPTGASVRKAIMIYDPGLSGAAKGVADKVATNLQAMGYTVTLAGVKSSAAGITTG